MLSINAAVLRRTLSPFLAHARMIVFGLLGAPIASLTVVCSLTVGRSIGRSLGAG